tara:strand:+ start:8266 stop:9594 length:1329 start_codon:yes stop_codon:yes gene_type:complete
MTKKITSIVLAAGKGTRMNSSLSKPLHSIAGKPMLSHVIDNTKEANLNDIIVVVSEDNKDIKDYLSINYPEVRTSTQDKQNGTGDAVKCVLNKYDLSDSDGIIVIFGDTPLIKTKSIEKLSNSIDKDDLTIMVFETENPQGYGRIILKDNLLNSIVEEFNATDEDKNIKLCNGGVMALKNKNLVDALNLLQDNNPKKEFILSDMVEIINEKGGSTNFIKCEELEIFGVDTKIGLAKAEMEYQKRLRKKFMSQGVTLLDPETVYFQTDTVIGDDVEIQNNVYFGKNVHLKNGVTIRSFSYIEDALIHENATIGPFSRLRGNVDIGVNSKIGNFVEIKNSKLGKDVKASHLSYLGDSQIGENANIGAGTITCNFDGVNKNSTQIGKNAFIGSNSSLVAPVEIGENSHIGAGSVITKNVEKESLVLTRAPLKTVSNWAKKFLGNN